MFSNVSLIYSLMLLAGDFLAILAAFVLAYIVRVTYSGGRPFLEVPAMDYLKIFLMLIPFWLIVFGALGLYRRNVYDRYVPEVGRLFIGAFIGVLIVIGYEFFSSDVVFPAKSVALYGFLTSFLLLVLFRTLMKLFRSWLFKFGFGVNRVMIIGSTTATKKLATLLADTASSGYEVVAIVGAKTSLPPEFSGKHYSMLEDGLRQVGRLNLHTIVQTHLFEQEAKNNKVLSTVHSKHLAYRFIPTQDQFYTGNHTVDIFHGFPVVAVHRTALIGWGKLVKRLIDLVGGFIGLLLLAPIFALTTIIILLFDFGPVLFKHQRITRFGRKINVYKFRTMKREYNGMTSEKAFAKMGRSDLIKLVKQGDSQVPNDPRISRVGKFLRKTSIDELPQLWNVLIGDMSLVGPRAIIPEEIELYKENADLLLAVKTGITGLAQVSGRSDLDYKERTRLNIYYVQNWSVWLDIKILLRTIGVVFAGTSTK